jgi:hypothetical protein
MKLGLEAVELLRLPKKPYFERRILPEWGEGGTAGPPRK